MLSTLPVPAPALAPIERALVDLRARRGPKATQGLVTGLVVPAGSRDGWEPAATLLDGGPALDRLLAAAAAFWSASPHAAASLAWRSYTYWLSMLAGLGWTSAHRVPLLTPEDVLYQLDGADMLLRLGLRRVQLAVLPDDPLVDSPEHARLVVVDSESELLALVRHQVRETHLDPLMARVRERVRLSERALLGSLASGAAYSVVRGYQAAPTVVEQAARRLLDALGVADLVTLEPGPAGPQVRRRTCCLAFTLPRPKVCSGCCLPTS